MFDVPYEVAAGALSRWEGDSASLDQIGTSGNAVYRWMDRGTPRILRLTRPDHRTHGQNEAELAFLRHLDRHAERKPLATLRAAALQRFTEPFEEAK